MSIFNFRRGRAASDKPAPAKAAPESVELIRKRARQRLIGSAVLVLIGIIGFPLLFESQPRPVPVDIPIEIPSRASVKPASPVPPVTRQEPSVPTAAAAAVGAAAAAPAVAVQDSLHEKEAVVEPRSQATSEPPKAQAKPEARPQPDDGQRAKALLEGAAPKTETADARIVVQVGAFADAGKAREARQKLEKAGLKTYTQVAETKEGSRIRVRVGPFASKAEAEKAATKIRSLNLPAAILVL